MKGDIYYAITSNTQQQNRKGTSRNEAKKESSQRAFSKAKNLEKKSEIIVCVSAWGCLRSFSVSQRLRDLVVGGAVAVSLLFLN